MLSRELYEKTLGSYNYAYVCVKNEMNIFLLIPLLSKNWKFVYNFLFFFFFFGHQKQISNLKTRLPKFMLRATYLITYEYFWLLYISNMKKNVVKKQKDLRLCWPQIRL